MDYLLVCDLWAPVTYRLNVQLKYYNGKTWMKKSWERNHDSGEHWRKRWSEKIERREMSAPFIEEGRQTSFIGSSVSPEWCHRGLHQINHLSLIHSPPLSLFLPPDSSNTSPSVPPPLFFPCPLSSPPFLTWEVITTQSPNQINSHLLGCGRPQNSDLLR